ncbi:MAG: DNA polymerase III subunit beta, partial [Aquificaceae bacterium]
IRATDYENFLTFTFPAQVEEEGKVLVDAEKLTKLVNSLPVGYMGIFATNKTLIVESGASKYKLPIEPADDYPEFPEAVAHDTLPNFKQALDKVSFAVGDRDALEGLYIQQDSHFIHYVCSNSQRLALFEEKGTLQAPALIHRKVLKALKHLLEDEVKIGVDQNFIHIVGTNWTLSARKLEYPYPNYLAVIPESPPPIVVDLDKQELLEKLKRLAVIGDMVVLTLQEGKVKLTVNDPEGEGEEEVEILQTHKREKELTIGFNIKYLIEALEHIDEPIIIFEAIDSDSVAVIKEYSEQYIFTNLIMPIRL